MLQPKKVKFLKHQRGRMTGKAYRGNRLAFGEYGLKALTPAWVSARQIEAARVAIMRCVRKGAKLWIRVFPDKAITKKPLETRMGKGKGPRVGYVAVVRPGRIIFEMTGVPEDVAMEAFRLAGGKLPVRVGFVRRGVIGVREL